MESLATSVLTMKSVRQVKSSGPHTPTRSKVKSSQMAQRSKVSSSARVKVELCQVALILRKVKVQKLSKVKSSGVTQVPQNG
jgi:hypothetical protein